MQLKFLIGQVPTSLQRHARFALMITEYCWEFTRKIGEGVLR